jgi:flagellar motor protein MotB
MPVCAIDLDGLEEFVVILSQYKVNGRTYIYKIDFEYIKQEDRNENYRQDGTVFVLTRNFTSQLHKNPSMFKKSVNNQLATNSEGQFELRTDQFEESYYKSIKKAQEKNQSSVLTNPSLIIWLGNDEGNSVLELKEKVNQSDGSARGIEEIAGRLYYDPSSKIKIIGNADPSPTNIDGTKPNVSGENNIDLALQRADAAENYLRNYYKETYGVDLSCERIKTDYDTESSRSISISINTTNQ